MTTTTGQTVSTGVYASCTYLESGLCLSRSSLRACAILHHGRGEPALVYPYAGEPLSLEALLAARAEIVRHNQKGGHAACRGCQFLERRAWQRADYPVRWLGITNWLRCNIECDYCWLQFTGAADAIRRGEVPVSSYDVAAVIERLLAADWLAPDAIIDWGGGGEPTIMPGFDELLVRLHEHGTTQWLHTNGVRLPAAIADGRVGGPRVRVLCSIDAGTSATYAKMKRRDFYHRVWQNMAAYATAGAQVTVKYIVGPQNWSRPEIDAFVRDAVAHGEPAIAGDLDYREPDPSKAVVQGLAWLQAASRRAGLSYAYNGMGANQQPEARVQARVDAVELGWRAPLAALLRPAPAHDVDAHQDRGRTSRTLSFMRRRAQSPYLALGLGAATLNYLVVWRFARATGARVRRSLLAFVPHLVKRLVEPRIGRLWHHAPTQLSIPRHYRNTKCPTPAPRISLVTPSRDQGAFLRHAAESVIAQGYPDLEYAIQDGASTDGTIEVLERLRPHVTRVVSRPDRGQAAALNAAFAASTGEIMGWLNADDMLLPGALRYVAGYFATHPEVDVVYGHRVLIDADGLEIGRWVLPPHDTKVLRWADFVPQETLFWRRAVWERAGAHIDEAFRFALDWELLLRFAARGANIVRLPRFLGAFRVHAGQKTNQHIGDLGRVEMNRLRHRALGRVVHERDVFRNVGSYMSLSVIYDYLWRLGLLRH